MKFGSLSQPFDVFKLMLKLVHTNSIEARELCSAGFLCKIHLTLPACGPCETMFFKLGMINTTKPYTFMPVLVSLTFAQGHTFTRKLERVQSFWCELARSGLCVGRELTTGKPCDSAYGEYGSL